MKKMLLFAAVVFSAVSLFATQVVGNSEKAFAESFFQNWLNLGNGELLRMASAMDAIREAKGNLSAEQAMELFNRKTPAEMIEIAKEVNPLGMANNIKIIEALPKTSTTKLVSGIRSELEIAKNNPGSFAKEFEAVNMRVKAEIENAFSVEFYSGVKDFSDDEVVAFIAALNTVQNLSKELQTEVMSSDAMIFVGNVKKLAAKQFAVQFDALNSMTPEQRNMMVGQVKSTLTEQIKIAKSATFERPNTKLNWYTNFDEAAKNAAEEKKVMFVLFTGSDWCPYCIKMDKELLSTNAFSKFAEKSLTLVFIDFPRKKQLPMSQLMENTALKDKYDIKGFPTVLLMTPEGKVLGTSGYEKMSAKDYVKSIEKIISGK